jgi:small subunit ribosomal protein S13
MPRIARVGSPRDKRVEISLTHIHGIGRSRSNVILAGTDVKLDTRVKDLNENEIARLRQFIDRNYEVEEDLRRRVGQNIQHLKEIGCYRGIRHRKGPRKTAAGRRKSKVKR